MELMQQAHLTLTKGSDTEKRISDLEAKLELVFCAACLQGFLGGTPLRESKETFGSHTKPPIQEEQVGH